MSPLMKKNVPPSPAQAFITLEGIDGCGKTTQARLLAAALERSGYDVVALREPGGTAISEKIRTLLLDPANAEMGTICELLLYEASRAQLVHEVIAPALEADKVVVCDRFYDSTTAYQAYAGGIDKQMVEQANAFAVDGCRPQLTLVYDLDPNDAAERRGERPADRMEGKGDAYQEKVARGFRAVATEDPNRVKLIPASDDIAHVFVRTVAEVDKLGLHIPREQAQAAFVEVMSPKR